MADAPAPSGGGSGWGTLEVILGLLLATAFLSNLNGKNVSKTSTVEPKDITTIDTSANKCGLSVTAPLNSQKVYGSVRLSGSVNGCNWKVSGTTALFAQVIDAKGIPVSDFITVQINNTDIINTTFDTTIAISRSITSGKGYLILIPAVQTDKSITVRIPLQFVQI